MSQYNILILGAAYGLLPATRLVLAGHNVTLVCRKDEREAIVANGARVTFGQGTPLEKTLRVTGQLGMSRDGKLGLVDTGYNVDDFDMVMLVMAEPHYAVPDVAALMSRIAKARLPVVSLMNMAPPAILQRLNGRMSANSVAAAFGAWDIWKRFDPNLISAASPDAQAVRADPTDLSSLTVTLASNFKVAPFMRSEDQLILETLAADVAAFQFEGSTLPCRIIAHSDVHVPLAKWPMLIAGNCRCLMPGNALRSIRDAVYEDLELTETLYNSVLDIVQEISQSEDGFVPFKAYARAAKRLTRPSSFARAIASGAFTVERVDKLVHQAAVSIGCDVSVLEDLVNHVDKTLETNRTAAA